MQTGTIKKFHFIDHSDDPRLSHRTRDGNSTLADTRRKAHAHAARTAHARKRIARTQEHLARKTNTTNSKVDLEINENRAYLLSPIGILSQSRYDPFECFATKLNPMERFLLDHYAQTVVPELNKYCKAIRRIGETLERMLREWVHFAMTDTGFLQGIFLASCRHLVVNNYQKEFFVEAASAYKMACVRNVINAINSKHIDMDATFATIFILAFDEIWLGDDEMFGRHADGAIKMVMLNGGPQRLGLNGFLRSLFDIVVQTRSDIQANIAECREKMLELERK